MPDERLQVWLGQEPVATLLRTRSGELRLRYADEAVERYGEGAIVLAVALPVSARRHRGTPVRFWAESWLPEGETRTALEQRFGVPRGDTFGLLTAIGADCAGAVAFLPPDATPVETLSGSSEMEDADLDEAIRDLPAQPLGVDQEVRVSLGGLQAKLLLTRTAPGRWARPAHGTPSTHIAKPEPPAYPGLVAAEAFSLALAKQAGVSASEFEITRWGNRPVLVVRRFDRRNVDGRVVRLHQEDCCAALGVDPYGPGKYQTDRADGPSLARIAGVLRSHGTNLRADLIALAEAVSTRVAVGDTDGHARNYGLLHTGHAVSLAPLYDVAPTSAFVTTRQVALWVGGQAYLHALTSRHLAEEFTSWGIPPGLARRLPGEVLNRLGDALPAARAAVPQVDGAIAEAVANRIDRLRHPRAT